jgi:outer membrane protein assembly factor BamA
MKHPNEKRRYRFRPFRQHTFVTKGEIYNERNFYRTINAFSQMGPWQQVDVRDSVRVDTVDLHVFLAPNPKATYKFDFELTRSTADFSSSTNLFGIGGNVSYLHRNVFRRAIQSVTTARAGVELNLEGSQDLFQTIQAGVGQTFSFPNLLWPYTRWNLKKDFDATRTLLNINANYTDRRNFFRVRSLMLNMGYEYKKKNKVYSLRFPVPFIELYSLDTLQLLRDEFKKNPFLRTAFNTGSVVGWAAAYNVTWPSRHNPKVAKHFRMGGEYAGLFGPWINKSWEDNLYHYLKGEFEYIHKYQFYDNTVLVLRAFTGIGYNLVQDEQLGRSLPFFKQFVAGGPNSMRGWGLRQLGLGSSQLSDTSPGFSDRFGDLQLEGNIEYRFPIATIGGTKFNSAVFLDVGNLWNLKDDPANPQARFRFRNFYRDMAVALGMGLVRLNIANFILRVDFALKLKDPARIENNGWLFPNFKWKNGEYPGKIRNNYAFQLGIGLPF